MVQNQNFRFVINLLFIAFMLSFLISCSSFITSSVQDLKKEIGVDSIPSYAQYPEDDGIILMEKHNTILEWKDQIKVRESIHKAVKLFKNVEEYTNVTIPISWDEKILQIEAQTYKPDGSKIVLGKKDFYLTETDNNSAFVSDEKTMKFTFPNVEKGSIIEYKIET